MDSKLSASLLIKVLSSLCLIGSLISCSSKEQNWVSDLADAPSNSYIQAYGNDRQVQNIACRAKTFKAPNSNKTVSLLGMIHMADSEFYEEAENFVQQHDLMLSEGVYGTPNLNLHHFIIQYISSYFDRIEYYAKLVPQALHFNPQIQHLNADLSLQEFSEESKAQHYLAQAVSLPIMIIAGETTNALLYLKKLMSFDFLFQENKIKNTQLDRRLLFANISEEDKHSDKILPGIISKRNQHLMNILSDALLKEDVNSIVIPWGAAHMPDIEKTLLEQGFIEKNTSWFNAINFNLEKLNKSFYFYIPYITYIYSSESGKEISFLFDIIKRKSTENYQSNSLLWHLLLSHSESENSYYLSVLPKIFNRPILFDYHSDPQQAKFRCFLFIELIFD